MSEYQYLAFRAVDRRLTERELAFARKQSTRAEITPWSFENEYHFGDFHGDVVGLLRRGFDAHLHYANFGKRRIAFRLPAGLPFPKRVWSKYIGVGELKWIKDRKGKGGVVGMGGKRKKGNGAPREKRMNRAARLQSAVAWLKDFDGRHILRSYCKHYGVDPESPRNVRAARI